MSDLPPELDLKFLPDWLKESPGANRYADYQGDSDDRPRRDRDDRRGPGGRSGPRPNRPGGGPGGPGGPRRDDRRGPQGARPPGGGNRPGGSGPRPGGGQSGRPGDRRDDRRSFEARPPREAPQQAPAQLKVELLPEPHAAAGIAKQIKASGRAYPVFGTSKLFLERPERHRVKVTSANPEVLLFQVGDGPISFDRAGLDKNAFFSAKAEYYAEETTQGEPIKGNFANVARVRATGALLGPTNYHGYQPALRKIYEERFSRRMSFPEFQQYEIEVVSDEQAVNDWKEQARSSTTYTTTKEAEPVVFKTLFEAEQHFRKNYLPQIVKSGTTLECSGQASRNGSDRFVGAAVREAWETESRFPQQMVNGLRPYFVEAGLHFFKHRKRVLFVSATKPVRHPGGQSFSEGISSILRTVEASPRIKRPDLATRILGTAQEDIETLTRKAQLASDLHYLMHMGHLIEFSDGALELPLSPQDKPPGQQQPQNKGQQQPKKGTAQPAAAAAAAAVVPAEEALEEASLEEETVSETASAEAPVEEATVAVESPIDETTAEEPSTPTAPVEEEPVDEASPTTIEPELPAVPAESAPVGGH